MTYQLTGLGLRTAWRTALSDACFLTGLSAAHDICLSEALRLLGEQYGEQAVSDLFVSGVLPERLRNAPVNRDLWVHRLSKAVCKSRDLCPPNNPKRSLALLTALHEGVGV